MNKYGQAALRAVELVELGKASNPIEAWEMATIEIFGQGTPSQVMGCPKNTFLAFCESGKVRGVKAHLPRILKLFGMPYRVITLKLIIPRWML